jgi:hypothetical protein
LIDIKQLLDSIKTNGEDAMSVEHIYRLIGSDKRIKYIKVFITKIVKSRLGIEKILGTVQDVSEIMILNNNRKHISQLLRLMDKFNNSGYYNIENLLQEISEYSYFSQVIYLDLENKYAYSSDKVFVKNSRLYKIIENMDFQPNENDYYDTNSLLKEDLDYLNKMEIHSFYFVSNSRDSKKKKAFVILDQCFEDRFDEQFVYYFKNLMGIIEAKQLV